MSVFVPAQALAKLEQHLYDPNNPQELQPLQTSARAVFRILLACSAVTIDPYCLFTVFRLITESACA